MRTKALFLLFLSACTADGPIDGEVAPDGPQLADAPPVFGLPDVAALPPVDEADERELGSALGAVHHDARSSTFVLEGELGARAHRMDSSTFALSATFGR